jgi:hypothetical protein
LIQPLRREDIGWLHIWTRDRGWELETQQDAETDFVSKWLKAKAAEPTFNQDIIKAIETSRAGSSPEAFLVMALTKLAEKREPKNVTH